MQTATLPYACTKDVLRRADTDQRLRWTALALMEMEPAWNKVHNFKRLSILQRAVQQELNKRVLNRSSKLESRRNSTRKRT